MNKKSMFVGALMMAFVASKTILLEAVGTSSRPHRPDVKRQETKKDKIINQKEKIIDAETSIQLYKQKQISTACFVKERTENICRKIGLKIKIVDIYNVDVSQSLIKKVEKYNFFHDVNKNIIYISEKYEVLNSEEGREHAEQLLYCLGNVFGESVYHTNDGISLLNKMKKQWEQQKEEDSSIHPALLLNTMFILNHEGEFTSSETEKYKDKITKTFRKLFCMYYLDPLLLSSCSFEAYRYMKDINQPQ